MPMRPIEVPQLIGAGPSMCASAHHLLPEREMLTSGARASPDRLQGHDRTPGIYSDATAPSHAYA